MCPEHIAEGSSSRSALRIDRGFRSGSLQQHPPAPAPDQRQIGTHSLLCSTGSPVQRHRITTSSLAASHKRSHPRSQDGMTVAIPCNYVALFQNKTAFGQYRQTCAMRAVLCQRRSQPRRYNLFGRCRANMWITKEGRVVFSQGDPIPRGRHEKRRNPCSPKEAQS